MIRFACVLVFRNNLKCFSAAKHHLLAINTDCLTASRIFATYKAKSVAGF